MSLLVLGLVTRMGTGVASAQGPDDALERAARESAVVAVAVDGVAEPIRGILRDVSGAGVTIDSDGVLRHLEMVTVRRIDRKGDSLVNGTLIGAAVLGGWCAVVCGQGSRKPLSYAAVVLGNAAIGAAFGAVIDLGRTGQTTVYRRPLDVRAARSGAAMHVTFRF